MARSALAAQKSPHGPAAVLGRLARASPAVAPSRSILCPPLDGAPPLPPRLARTVGVPRAQARRYSWLRPTYAPPSGYTAVWPAVGNGSSGDHCKLLAPPESLHSAC